MREHWRWYVRRFLAMSPLEIAFRARRYLQVKLEAMAWRRRGKAGRRARLRPAADEHKPVAAPSRHRELRQQVETTSSLFPDLLPRTLKSVARISAGELQVFGHAVRVDSLEAWLLDPRTQRRWPSVFWSDVSYRHGRAVGGPLWVWELNRHHHLDPLARAYVLAGDGAAKSLILNELADWIDANPLETGINWASSLELAVRLINWCWAAVLIWEPGDERDPRWHKILASIQDQADHIYHHMSAYSSANNHLVGEAAGLAVAGACFPWMQGAGRWAARGRQVLTQELERQILPDGVPAEQALGYLAFILDLNLIAWHGFTQDEPPEPWQDRLAAAGDFLAHMMDEHGHVPHIGDSDAATVLSFYDRPAANRFGPALAAAASLAGRPEFKAASLGWDPLAHWTLGSEGKARFDSIDTAVSAPGSKAFRDGGYCVMRAPGRMLILDCGPLGYLSTAAHGHADALSLWAHIEGEPLLVDSGTYAYQEGGRWRTYFRGTSAHNTVVVDGMDQSEQQGEFLWGNKASTRLLRWVSTPDYDLAVAEHDGYRSLKVTHRRSILFTKPDWLLVVDELQGTGRHWVEQFWHLPSSAALEQDSTGWTIGVGAVRARMIPLQADNLTIEVVRGEERPIQGWVSSAYGSKEAAPVIRLRGNLALPVRLAVAYHLSPQGGEADPVPATLLAQFDHLNEGANQL